MGRKAGCLEESDIDVSSWRTHIFGIYHTIYPWCYLIEGLDSYGNFKYELHLNLNDQP